MSLQLEELPVLGLGASLSLSAQPDPIKLIQTKDGLSLLNKQSQ
jgi:hypothetical protein